MNNELERVALAILAELQKGSGGPCNFWQFPVNESGDEIAGTTILFDGTIDCDRLAAAAIAAIDRESATALRAAADFYDMAGHSEWTKQGEFSSQDVCDHLRSLANDLLKEKPPV